jgi:hypothetical protein
MTRFTIGAGLALFALVLTGCAPGEPAEPSDADSVTAPQTDAAPDGDSGSSDAVAPSDACELYAGIDVDALIGTAAGEFNSGDDECSVGAADAGQFAQSSITLGAAPAMMLFRSNFEGPLYEDCEVVDVAGLGDEAFTCLGGRASSHVVFAQGELLVIFTAGNTVVGPPADSIMMDAAQQVSANLLP